MLSSATEIDKIEVLSDGVILVREATTYYDDWTEIKKTYKRWSLTPGQDISNQEQRVKNICNVAWTQDIIDAYIASRIRP